jgi:UDP-N-acetyl-D-glucosamine dehydrogenase
MAEVKHPGYKPVAYQPVAYSGLQYDASSFAAADSGIGAPTREALLGKINIKDAAVGVVGLGNVGLPLAVEFADAGYNVVGIDSDERVAASIAQGVSHVCDVPKERLLRLVEKGKLTASADYAALSAADCILICVPTPLTKSKEPDITYIAEALDRLFPLLRRGMLVVLESTTYPGTTEELIAERIERELGLKVGEEIFVVFSPERVDPGNPKWRTKNTPKVLGGVTPFCTEIGRALYAAALDKVHTVRSAREAETVKLLENTFRAVNIGLVNELMLMCERMHIDIWSVIEAASTKPFGFMPFYPGPGIGGHCIPLDPLYLSWKARAVDFHNRFIELATDINGNMPRFVVQKLQDLLNDREKSLKGAKIMILGMAYKKNVNDLRESPGLEIYRLLRLKGAWVEFFDPHIPSFVSMLGKTVPGTPIIGTDTAGFDAAVLVTDHDAFDYKRIVEGFRAILDCRNAFASRGIVAKHIVKL